MTKPKAKSKRKIKAKGFRIIPEHIGEVLIQLPNGKVVKRKMKIASQGVIDL